MGSPSTAPTNMNTPNRLSEMTISEILSSLTLQEKVALTHGSFLSGGVPRLNVPELELADGPVGIRLPSFGVKPKSEMDEEVEETKPRPDQPGRATALPATLLLASTWNKQTAYEYAKLLAHEMKASKKHVLLAPGINLMRDPRGGRNYEYFGDDPFLTAECAIAYVRGLQDNGVGANLKHFLGNECDRSRHFTSSNISTPVLREVYAYPFERSIREANAWSVMTGNNLCQGVHMSENAPLLKELLREEFNFDGVILTDWRAAYSYKASALATLDMTTGFCKYVYGDDSFMEALESNQLPMTLIDNMARRILQLYERVGLLSPQSPTKPIDTKRHAEVARQIATEGMVLLKNERELLPVKAPGKIVLTGPGALKAQFGTGSGLVNNGEGNCSPFDGFVTRYGKEVVSYFETVGEEELIGTDLVIYFANAPAGGEGFDLETISLPDEQIEAINSLGEQTDKLLVILQTGTATETIQWDDSADALLIAWYGGEAAGHAMADLVSGALNPSGRLPCNFGNALEDYPCFVQGTWPAKLIVDKHPGKAGLLPSERKKIYALAADYTEGFLIGHRWFDRTERQPRFPFGFGLTYGDTSLQNLKITAQTEGWLVQCCVSNLSNQTIDEVVQLYLSAPSSAKPERPVRQLRGFTKVHAPAGDTTEAYITILPRDLAIYDETSGWICEAGDYTVWLGRSSQDLPLRGTITLSAPQFIHQSLAASV
tara:strand:- start:47734 stop:49881 length:2148 start_codon:yes stop_codon:yes gene_type:complete